MLPDYVAASRPATPRASALATFAAPLLAMLSALVAFTPVFRGHAWLAYGAALSAMGALLSRFLRSAWLYTAAGALTTSIVVYRGPPLAIAADLGEAWEVINATRAPIEANRGTVALLGVTMLAAVRIADRGARRGKRALVVGPAAVLYGAGAIYGARGHELIHLVTFVAGVSTAVLLLTPSIARQRRASGVIIVAAALATALAVGPQLPGANRAPLLTASQLSDEIFGGPEMLPDPLVSMRAQLIDQSNKRMFTVTAPRAEYWRLSVLDSFDGSAWSATAGAVAAAPEIVRGERFSFAIDNLRGKTLPSVLNATAADLPQDRIAMLDARRSELETNVSLGRGFSYSVVAAAPSQTALAPAERARFTELPESARSAIATTARDIITAARASNTTARARALEQWFLANFRYDLDVAAGNSIASMSDFLQLRAGYCEQFATTFAAMARSIGIPARVVVGYSTGEQEISGAYVVRGVDAHAWPEVFIEGRGWVRFEPTPGRGALTPGSVTTTTLPATAPPTTASVVPSTTSPEAAVDEPASEISPAPVLDPTDSPGQALARASAAVVIVAIALCAPLLAGAAWRRWLRWRARGRPDVLIEYDWQDAVRSLVLAGVEVRQSDTPREVVRRADAIAPAASEPLRLLARATEQMRYADAPPHPETSAVAARDITQSVRRQLGHRYWLRRWRRETVGRRRPNRRRRDRGRATP